MGAPPVESERALLIRATLMRHLPRAGQTDGLLHCACGWVSDRDGYPSVRAQVRTHYAQQIERALLAREREEQAWAALSLARRRRTNGQFGPTTPPGDSP